MVFTNNTQEAGMPLGSHSRLSRAGLVVLILTFVILTAVIAPTVSATQPHVVVSVADTVGPPGSKNAYISVFLDNWIDTVAAFSLWIQCDRPDIMKFKTDSSYVTDTTYWKCKLYNPPTICIDSVMVPKDSAWTWRRIFSHWVLIGNVDTVKTNISGWQYVTSRSISGTGNDILVTAMARTAGGLPNVGLKPQQTGKALFRLRGSILNIPDTMTDRTVKLRIHKEFLDKYNFSTPAGNSIGIYTVQVPDTSCFHCLNWLNGHCTQYQKVYLTNPPVCDSMSITMINTGLLDSNIVKGYNGSLTVLLSCCVGTTGNVDGSADGVVDISDIFAMVDYLASSIPLSSCQKEDDVNIDGTVDISDMFTLIDYLASGIPLPNCP